VGEGIGAKIMARAGGNITGVDIDQATIELASKGLEGLNVKLVCASAINLPFADGYFDMITSIETIEHLPTKLHQPMMTEFKRVLKKDGMLIVSTPNHERSSRGKIAPSNYFHLKEFTFDELSALMESLFVAEKKLGLYNPQREPSLEILRKSLTDTLNKPSKLSFKKKLLRLLPFWIKDLLSVLINKNHIYQMKEEYIFIEQDADLAADLVFVMRNSK